MSQDQVPIDEVPEDQLPAHARDGRTGDRMSVLDDGLVHVVGGRGAFVRWSELLAVAEHEAAVYLLVPRARPAPPWLVVHGGMLSDRSSDALTRFARRAREGGAGQASGYRDVVRHHRQGLSREALRAAVDARAPLPGMLEIPPTEAARRPRTLVAWGALYLGLRRLRAAREARRPPRVLVLTPDGCVIGATDGVRTLVWTEVGGFKAEWRSRAHDAVLVVYASDGTHLSEVSSSYIGAPLSLVVALAEAYREAATVGQRVVRV